MNLLLDTHVFLWWIAGNARLGSQARILIEDPESVVWISAASAWEIAIKAGLGRLELDEPPETCLPRELEQNGFRALPVTFKHALVTADVLIHQYDVRVIDARK